MLNPEASLLCKLSSIVVHTDEFLSDDGHYLDKAALQDLLVDEEVVKWINEMTKAGLAPVKRN